MGWTNKYKPLRDEALRCLERHWSSVTELSEAECAEYLGKKPQTLTLLSGGEQALAT